jgi:hypothetical protein
LGGTVGGCKDGFAARARDDGEGRNPNGIDDRHDRVVEQYDWR